jgi:hypothetical protein
MIASGSAVAVEFNDDFSHGINLHHWDLFSNQPLFTCDDSGGDVFFSKPYGGAGGFEAIWLCLAGDIVGDFDMSVDFIDAMLEATAPICNNAALSAILGGVYFAIVRNDCDPGPEGHSVGLWVDPPGQAYGFPETATSGLFRLTRVGTTVTGYFNDIVLHQGTYNDEGVTGICLNLANDGTRDAVSVHFDNFHLNPNPFLLFSDSFESGDTSAWSHSVP